MGGRKLSLLPAGAGLVGLGLALGLAAVAAGRRDGLPRSCRARRGGVVRQPPAAGERPVRGPRRTLHGQILSRRQRGRLFNSSLLAGGNHRQRRRGFLHLPMAGQSKDGNPTTYVLFEERTHTRSVTVTDANGNQRTSNPPAEIVCSASGGVGGASDGERGSIPVPLGGTLDLVWGNGGLTSASSKDAGVATASVVSGHELTVTGVSVGETDIVVQAGGVEYWLPVRVEDG